MRPSNGSTQSFYREDGDEYNIRVRYAPRVQDKCGGYRGNILVYNSAGRGIRVKDLGTVVEDMTPPTIERKNRERTITVSAVVGNGYALSDVYASAQKVIRETDIPSELSVVIAGDVEDQQDTFSDLFVLLILIVILVYMVMASQFESFMSPFVIMFSIPFALTGVILGLTITRTALGLMAMIGIIILMGIVVKNGIVLIDYTILLRERGMSIADAVVLAGKSRLRPILMTDPHHGDRYGAYGCRAGRRLGNVALARYDRLLGTFGLDACDAGADSYYLLLVRHHAGRSINLKDSNHESDIHSIQPGLLY